MSIIIALILSFCFFSIAIAVISMLFIWSKLGGGFQNRKSIMEEMSRQFKEARDQMQGKSTSTDKKKKSSKIEEKVEAEDAKYSEVF